MAQCFRSKWRTNYAFSIVWKHLKAFEGKNESNRGLIAFRYFTQLFHTNYTKNSLFNVLCSHCLCSMEYLRQWALNCLSFINLYLVFFFFVFCACDLTFLIECRSMHLIAWLYICGGCPFRFISNIHQRVHFLCAILLLFHSSTGCRLWLREFFFHAENHHTLQFQPTHCTSESKECVCGTVFCLFFIGIALNCFWTCISLYMISIIFSRRRFTLSFDNIFLSLPYENGSESEQVKTKKKLFHYNWVFFFSLFWCW